MKISKGTVTAAVLLAAGLAGATSSAHADVLNIPASAALMTGNYPYANCNVVFGAYGIEANGGSGICDFEIPIEIPVGHTIQQIELVSGSSAGSPGGFVDVYLSTFDPSVYFPETHFQKTWNLMPGGAIQPTRLMQQTKYGAFPDAFVTQPSTIYQLVVHLESGAFASAVRVTYQ